MGGSRYTQAHRLSFADQILSYSFNFHSLQHPCEVLRSLSKPFLFLEYYNNILPLVLSRGKLCTKFSKKSFSFSLNFVDLVLVVCA